MHDEVEVTYYIMKREFRFGDFTNYEIVKKLPSADAVPVVRCKDCKYGDTGIDEEGKPFWKCIGIHYGFTKPTDFCSDGERKDNG